ncbi:MAG: hypothetical protein J0G96_02405 [Flavobacteriia bacterium]|uniref:hypothetical protein n=1 Tax=uncultured Flavobacterium sp. TaxID=165435 RepID=UPI0009626832|nr:hypothetical protein [uncultured Flavobacterium sp.]MBN9292814.1 hypothetical protein [Flavobacteriia bacterium]OJX37094.1 MAG: hypothetical protein BGO87_15125 [Flavobacteriia bacterium 40-80]
MPRISKFPIILDEVPHLNILSLSRRGFLGVSKTGTISWSNEEETIMTISVRSEISESASIILSYTYNGIDRQYMIKLEEKQSNLGKGTHWYFVCPVTKKRCRKLYFIGGFFLHREAFKNIACYRSQTESKSWREIRRLLERRYVRDEVENELNTRYFKTSYNGKLTKSYLKLMRKIHG